MKQLSLDVYNDKANVIQLLQGNKIDFNCIYSQNSWIKYFQIFGK